MNTPCTLITGASSGIGRATAVLLSAQGPLLLHGRDEARLEETRALCTNPDSHTLWPCDLADPPAAGERLAELLLTRGLGVTRFVHCAGAVTVGPARLLDHAVLRNLLAVNLESALVLLRVLLGKRTNPAAFEAAVFVSSTYGIRGGKGMSAYSASKAALDGAVRSLALELAPRARVNAVCPGGVRTPMALSQNADPEFQAREEARHPLGLGEPADVAGVIGFLLSPQARWITGQTLVVDGGLTLH